jgi:hypothetical protein
MLVFLLVFQLLLVSGMPSLVTQAPCCSLTCPTLTLLTLLCLVPGLQVEFSKQLNESRIKVLQAREEAVQKLLDEAFAAMAALSTDKAAYKRLLTDLLVQVRTISDENRSAAGRGR